MIRDHDTIAAPATAAGGALAVIRISGEEALRICDRIFRGRKPLAAAAGYTVHYGEIVDDGRVLDDVLVTVFRAPRSYTGEDAAEISCHGSQYIVSEILRLLTASGPEPGRGARRRIHHPRLPRRQVRPLAGRGRGRHHRFIVARGPCARREPDAGRLFRRAGRTVRKAAGTHCAPRTGTRLFGGRGRIRRPRATAGGDAADRGAYRRPAQFVHARECHQGGGRRSDHGSPERRQEHPAQPSAQRRARPGLGHRGHDTRRHRGADQHRRGRLSVPRHGGHPRNGRPAGTDGHPAHDVEHRAGADRDLHDRCGTPCRRCARCPGIPAPCRPETAGAGK